MNGINATFAPRRFCRRAKTSSSNQQCHDKPPCEDYHQQNQSTVKITTRSTKTTSVSPPLAIRSCIFASRSSLSNIECRINHQVIIQTSGETSPHFTTFPPVQLIRRPLSPQLSKDRSIVASAYEVGLFQPFTMSLHASRPGQQNTKPPRRWM